MLGGFNSVRALASSPDHIIPGHGSQSALAHAVRVDVPRVA